VICCSSGQSTDLLLFGAIDKQHTIQDLLVRTRFHQQGDHDQDIGGTQGSKLLFHHRPNTRVQDGLKLMPGIGIGEYAPAQGSSIQGTICLHHLIAECCPDRFQRHLPRGGQGTRDDIRIDYRHTMSGKQISDGRLARADPASEADLEHQNCAR